MRPRIRDAAAAGSPGRAAVAPCGCIDVDGPGDLAVGLSLRDRVAALQVHLGVTRSAKPSHLKRAQVVSVIRDDPRPPVTIAPWHRAAALAPLGAHQLATRHRALHEFLSTTLVGVERRHVEQDRSFRFPSGANQRGADGPADR